MQIEIAISGFRTVSLSQTAAEHLVAAVERAVSTPPARSAQMRVAADLTFAVRLADGEHAFELLAGGTVLRDPVTRNVWQFEEGRAILQSLCDFETLRL